MIQKIANLLRLKVGIIQYNDKDMKGCTAGKEAREVLYVAWGGV